MTSLTFFDEWDTYGKVVAHDYMHHFQYFAALISYLSAKIEGPVAVVDLGCGDARPMLPLLQHFEVSHYTGIDQSPEALALATTNLSAVGIPVVMVEGSMQTGISSVAGPCQLITASYSMHHLTAQEKLALLTEARRLLAPGGVLAIIDVFLEPGETRADYHNRWAEHARQSFRDLTAGELTALINHVRSADLPESLSTYEALGQTAGFATTHCLLSGPERLNKLIVLR